MSSQAPQKKKSSKPRTTVLTDVMSFSSDHKTMKTELQNRMTFDPPVYGSVPNSNPLISFYRVPFGIKNPDNTEGDVIIDMDRCFSFGTGENRSPDTQALNGYSTSISMYDRDGATERQVRTVQFIATMSEVIKEHLLLDDIKAAMDSYELEAADLKKLDPLYYKRDKGKLVEGASPSFYPKLIWYKAGKDKNGKERPANMKTTYYLEDEVDENGEQVEADPMDFMGVRHYITAAVKFESVFMGAKTKNIQCKVYEAEVKAADTGPKRLLKISSTRTPTVIISGANPLLKKSSVADSKDESDESSSKPSVKGVTRPVVHAPDEELHASDEETDYLPVKEAEVKASKKVTKVKVTGAKKE